MKGIKYIKFYKSRVLLALFQTTTKSLYFRVVFMRNREMQYEPHGT